MKICIRATLKERFPPGGLSCPIFHFLHDISRISSRPHRAVPAKGSAQVGTTITLCGCHSEACPTGCDRPCNESPFIGLLHHVCPGSFGSTACAPHFPFALLESRHAESILFPNGPILIFVTSLRQGCSCCQNADFL